MYNLPEMRAQQAAFWDAMRVELARRGVAGLPEELIFDQAPVPERIAPDMVFTQVCGWPLQTIYAGQTIMLGMPVYDAPFCAGPTHAGAFVVHRDSVAASVGDLRGCDFVFNSLHSNSGMNLPRRLIVDIAGGGKFFGAVRETGSHPDNLRRVADGEADATCVDSVTYAFVARHRPAVAARLRILAPTPQSPSIPFVTSVATPPDLREHLGAALRRVAQAPDWAQVREGLLLRDIVPPAPDEYAVLCRYEAESVDLGYAILN
jgi:ABC-type phosphate/phosphonate transport system substrate-binding protein